MPPSTPMTCPVIQVELSDNKKLAILPMSEGSPTRFRGCLSSIFSFFLSFPNNLLAKATFGDTFFFDQIRVMCPGDEVTRKINGLSIKVQ